MIVKNLMTTKIKALSPKAKLREAAQAMKRLRVGALPVVDGERLVGIITDRDIVVRAIAEGRDVSRETVERYMSHEPHTCFDDDNVEDARRLMENRQIRRVPILSRERRLVGILSLKDIATGGAGAEEAGQTISRLSKDRPAA